jgi:hypothetical protein
VIFEFPFHFSVSCASVLEPKFSNICICGYTELASQFEILLRGPALSPPACLTATSLPRPVAACCLLLLSGPPPSTPNSILPSMLPLPLTHPFVTAHNHHLPTACNRHSPLCTRHHHAVPPTPPRFAVAAAVTGLTQP